MSNQPDAALTLELNPPRAVGSVLFVTNRQNLLEILTAGYIGPRAAFPKYYADLLDVCPGRLPLLRGPVSEGVLSRVSGDPETSFPVALELDTHLLARGTSPALDHSGHAVRADLRDEAVAAWAPSGAIPLTAVRRVVFRSNRDREEHSARQYEGLPGDGPPLEVDASLFAGSPIPVEPLLAWLAGLPALDHPAPGDVTAIDRTSGACCLAMMAASTAEVGLRIANEFLALGNSQRAALSSFAREEGIPAWISRASVVGRSDASARADLETKLFIACAKVMRQQDTATGWRPIEVVDEVDRIVRSKKLSKKDDEELRRNLGPIYAILRNEREFKPFKPGVGLAVAKSLLLVLLRRKPEAILQSSIESTGVDTPVVLTAAVLAGLLHGRIGLPLALRPRELDRYLAFLASQELSEGDDSVRTVPGVLAADKRSIDGEERVSLTWGDSLLREWRVEPPQVSERLAALNLSDPTARKLAIAVCRVLDWRDCVRSHMEVEGSQVAVSATPRGGPLRVSFTGWHGEVVQELDQSAFQQRLAEAGVPREREDAIQRLFESSETTVP